MKLQMENPDDTPDRPAHVKVALGRMKAEVYQCWFGIMLKNTIEASWKGSIFACGDGITRRAFPDVVIESLDGKEACAYCGTRAAQANVPCARCMVPKDQQHAMDAQFTPRTKAVMQTALAEAEAAPNQAQKEKVLRRNGIHDTLVRILIAQGHYLLVKKHVHKSLL